MKIVHTLLFSIAVLFAMENIVKAQTPPSLSGPSCQKQPDGSYEIFVGMTVDTGCSPAIANFNFDPLTDPSDYFNCHLVGHPVGGTVDYYYCLGGSLTSAQLALAFIPGEVCDGEVVYNYSNAAACDY